METGAPVTATWTHEDDLLLKNAMEAGASLEALGKSAITFSQKFTYKELRDRWHSLLYDPDVAAHASVHMFDLELTGLIPSSKTIKTENYKGHKGVPEKRQRSIRKRYYAMRKRLRSELISSTDFGFLNENIIHDCHDHGSNMREPIDGKFVSDSLGLQKADLDILRNVFPETARGYDSSAVGGPNNSCSAECRNLIIDDYPNRIFNNEFTPESSSLLREDGRDPSLPDIKSYEISRAAKSDASTSCRLRSDNEFGLVHVLPGKRLFRNSGKEQLSTYDSGLDNPQSARGFGGSQLLGSPNAEANSPLQVNGCSSPQPIWKTMEDFSVPSMPVCMGNQGTAQVTATLLPGDDAGKGVRSSMFDIVQSGPFLGLEHSGNDFMHAPVASDGDFVDISDSLLNLSNDDEVPFTDVDEKEAMVVNDNVNLVLQNSTDTVQIEARVKLEPEILNSEESRIILRNSPSAVHLEDKVKCEPDLVMVVEPSKRAPIDPQPAKMVAVPSSPLDEHNVLRHLDGNPPVAPRDDSSIPSTSAISAEPRELDVGLICCLLNTEDPNIPCNDDIFLLIHPSPIFSSSTSPPFSADALSPDSTYKGNIIEQQMNSSINWKVISQSFKQHLNVIPICSEDAQLANPHPNSIAKPKLLDAARVGVPHANASRDAMDSSVNRLCNVTSNPSTDRLLGKDVTRAQLKKEDTVASFLEIPQYAETAVAEPAINTTLSDPEESQSDDDVPYPSDVEAVILEMDLDLPEGESSITKQAFRFLPEDVKTIVRLEQCARTSLRRTLTHEGAFAILYGHRLRHYIKKPEVVLGRSTDDLEVDIDLSKEGRANTISRRQAIIKMGLDGSFSLKNIGKGVIFVNGESIYTGQSLILGFSCLIEISRMSFAFEVNQKYVRRHMDAIARQKTEKNKFDWSSDDIS